MTRFALVSLGLALVFSAALRGSASPEPHARGFALEHRSPASGGEQQNLHVRSPSMSNASVTSTLWYTHSFATESGDVSPKMAYSANATLEPATSASGIHSASTTSSYTSHDVKSGRSHPSSYFPSTASMAPLTPSGTAPAGGQVIDIVVLQLAVILEVCFESALHVEPLQALPGTLLTKKDWRSPGVRRNVLPRRPEPVWRRRDDGSGFLTAASPHHAS